MSKAATATRAVSIKTPGMPDPAPEGDDRETDADAAMAAAPGFDDGAKPSAQEAKPAKLDANAMPPDVQAFIAEAVARGIAQGLAAARGTPVGDTQAAELPDQSEINPKKITVPTLSKQGYVIPIGYGEPKHLPRE
jgi:hypothetical protein